MIVPSLAYTYLMAQKRSGLLSSYHREPAGENGNRTCSSAWSRKDRIAAETKALGGERELAIRLYGDGGVVPIRETDCLIPFRAIMRQVAMLSVLTQD